jgi:hypothetical protein
VQTVSRVKIPPPDGLADEWIAVTRRRAAAALEPLAEYRAKTGAGSAAIVCLEDLTVAREAPSEGGMAASGPANLGVKVAVDGGSEVRRPTDKGAVRDAIAAFARACRKRGGARHFFLVADADEIPAGLVNAGGSKRFGCLSDAVYAQDDDDPLPDASVGRLPTSDPERVKVYVKRVLDYGSTDAPAGWRKRIAFLAGSGGFGPAVDGAIDVAVSGLLDRELPAEFDLRVLRPDPGSAFGVKRDDEARAISEFWNAGALVVLYAGHGSRHGLHTATGLGVTRTIFTSARARELDIRNGAPFVMMFACNTAEFAPVKYRSGGASESRSAVSPACLAEALLVNTGGAVAVFGASEVSHPYPDLLLAHEVNEVFRAQPKLPLGEMVMRAKRRMSIEQGEFRRNVDQIAALFGLTEDERRLLVEHEQALYQYLGDPAVTLRVPDVKLDISGPATVKAGDEFEFHFASKGLEGARVVARLEAPRGAAPKERGYPAANGRVLDQSAGVVEGPTFMGRFTAPSSTTLRRLVVSVDVSRNPRPGVAHENRAGGGVLASGAHVVRLIP